MLADADATCSCGLKGPIVSSIEGRRLDFLYRPDGARINAGNVANLLKYLPNSVIRSQFKQERMDEIAILLEVDESRFEAGSESEVLEECRHTFGNEMHVIIQVVDEIPRAPSGKYQLIINQVKETIR